MAECSKCTYRMPMRRMVSDSYCPHCQTGLRSNYPRLQWWGLLIGGGIGAGVVLLIGDMSIYFGALFGWLAGAFGYWLTFQMFGRISIMPTSMQSNPALNTDA